MGVGFTIIKILMWMNGLLLGPLFRILQIGKKKKCPPISNPLLTQSATKLAHLIRTRQISSESVIRAFITRAQEVNPVLNAIVQDRYELAICDAQAVDKLIALGEKTEEELQADTPLLGVPITIKESIAVQGMSNDAGKVKLVKESATEDADLVRLIKLAGVIPILVSNTPELCMSYETFNNVTGVTLNPYDTRRTPGGSSGGEGALLGSAASVIGLGSDIGGSLRLPALYNGIFAHKPTFGLVSLNGNVPTCDDERYQLWFTNGIMARYAEDLPVMLSSIVKQELRATLKLFEPVELSNIKFYYMESQFKSVDRSTREVFRQFIAHLEKEHGILAKKVDIKLLNEAFSIASFTMLGVDKLDSPFYDKKLQKFRFWPVFFRYITCRSNHIFPVILYGMLRKCIDVMKSFTERAKRDNEMLKTEMQELLGENGVFLCPTFAHPANFHKQLYYKVINSGLLSIYNSLGLPATHCPMGLNSNSLPIGIQVVSRTNNDRLNLVVAQEIEKVFGGWKPPPSEMKNICV
ncbi:uncharacterized protein CBL_04821 [Carabus blaptoides fortunei]